MMRTSHEKREPGPNLAQDKKIVTSMAPYVSVFQYLDAFEEHIQQVNKKMHLHIFKESFMYRVSKLHLVLVSKDPFSIVLWAFMGCELFQSLSC